MASVSARRSWGEARGRRPGALVEAALAVEMRAAHHCEDRLGLVAPRHAAGEVDVVAEAGVEPHAEDRHAAARGDLVARGVLREKPNESLSISNEFLLRSGDLSW